jgi:IclR family transcriptional regulator, KDG regulon repressor
MNEYSAPIIRKAIEVLVLAGRENRPLGVSEASRVLAYSKSTTYGIFKALSDVGLLHQDPATKKYTIGRKLLRLAKIIYKNQDTVFIIRPFLEELAELIDETVFFGIRERNVVTILIVIEARQSFKISSPVGTKIPLTAGAVGKVFLSALENDEIVAFLKKKSLPKYTENSIQDGESFIGEIENTRKLGYAIDLEEYLKGVRAVASLVYQDGHPIGAIWTVGFSSSMTDEKLQYIAERLKITAGRINKRISFSDQAGREKKTKKP